MKKVLLLAPRLDCMFKKGPVPPEIGSIAPIRKHWRNFIERVISEYSNRTDVSFKVLELPLWQFTPELVNELKPDIVFVPHKEAHSFPVENCEVYYYMQTAFPWMFSVDRKGWGAGSSKYPFDCKYTGTAEDEYNGADIFNMLQNRMNDNQSKFEQPIYQSREKINLPDYYAFFPCQIPHDETIKFHSDVTVEEALERTCIATQEIGMNLVVKGHPVNPGSMQSLKEIAKKYLHVTWYDDVSIHQLIQTARCTVTVNSGVGFESLLHKIPVVTFGRSEYDCVTYKVNSNTDLGKTIKQASHSVFNYEEVCDFYNSWWKYCYDSKNGDDFTKLPS